MLNSSKAVAGYLSLIVIFALWHGLTVDWSLHQFINEYRVLSEGFTRVLVFQLNPFKPLKTVKARFGDIPVKPDYYSFFMLKWASVATVQLLLFSIIGVFTYSEGKSLIRRIYKKDIPYFFAVSLSIFIIFVGTYTAHPQRILEHLIFTCSGFAIYLCLLSNRLGGRKKAARKALYLFVIITLLLTPLKLFHYWGTSLTYIGFPEKTLNMLSWFANHTTNPLDRSIHYVGTTPYWFLTDILSNKRHFYPISLNGHESGALFEETINNLNNSLHIADSHYIIIDLTGMFSIRAKYELEPYIDDFLKNLNVLSSKANVVYIEAPTHMVWLTE